MAQITFTRNLKKAARGFFSSYFKLEVEGLNQLPSKAAVVAAFHPSYLDPPLITAAYPRLIRNLAKLELFDGTLQDWLITQTGGIAIDRNDGSAGIAYAVKTLQEGTPILIFPEGRLAFSGRMRPLKKGPIVLAIRANCPIVPATTLGAQAAWPEGQSMPRSSPLKVVFGEPYWISYDGDPTNIPEEVITQELARLTERIAALLPEEYRPLTDDSQSLVVG